MTLDLYAILNGRPADAFADEVRQYPLALAIRCRCGDRVASVHDRNGRMTAVCRGRRLTRKHTAEEVFAIFLLDAERVLSRSSSSSDGILRRFDVLTRVFPSTEGLTRQLPALRLPDLVPRIGGLVEIVVRERSRAAEARVMPSRVAGMQASCASCRCNYYVADEISDWLAASDGPTTIVVSEVDKWSPSVSYAESWPTDAIGSRLRLYEHLSGVLQR